ncbi:MAG: hypothetical protein COT81_03390 [Candidatus Buchananbacteria bacterium CG10_big_fil_rev_8_21_14_0_10_42_9]|uniref:Antitoxin n=1 Tax=Candidatus Buchananbacteria bacterium CG10_big_fil_rev_8_21_14_0_10_42_9 TaxID=1974526 RepID=A0A2H0W2Z4_9BACT|nr:MAG: hypothetical protein COT81_03390 [Candidatus Buchananbacteria bacterium CG10_big_fil_rev_8_21_14_0_10_42_9]
MTTKFIGVKEFRQNMAKISNQARKKNQRLIVLRKNQPLFELRPLTDEESLTETLRRDIAQAKKDVNRGNLYTTAEAEKMLGL